MEIGYARIEHTVTWLLALSLALATLTGVPAVSASQTYPGPPSIGELARRSEVVAIGDVLSASGARDRAGGEIQTRVELRIVETLKGAPGSTASFTQAGGQVGDQVATVAGAVTFERGERVLVFLERRDGSLRLTDPFHGKFVVQRDARSGRHEVVRATGAPTADRLPLDQVRAEVRRAGGPS